jgi:hypothetical protein
MSLLPLLGPRPLRPSAAVTRARSGLFGAADAAGRRGVLEETRPAGYARTALGGCWKKRPRRRLGEASRCGAEHGGLDAMAVGGSVRRSPLRVDDRRRDRLPNEIGGMGSPTRWGWIAIVRGLLALATLRDHATIRPSPRASNFATRSE